jgi:hypothetical protein
MDAIRVSPLFVSLHDDLAKLTFQDQDSGACNKRLDISAACTVSQRNVSVLKNTTLL